MASVRHWCESARPKTLIASISPICIGAVLCRNSPLFSLSIFFSILLAGIFLQVATNFANDLFDGRKGADNLRIGPRRAIASNLISEKSMTCAIYIALGISSLFSFFLVPSGGYIVIIFLLLGILMAIFYTAGPYALAYLGLGDFVVFFFFGPVATAFTYYLLSSEFSFSAFFAGLAPGALSTAILIINNLRDQLTDHHVNKKTLVVRLGKEFGILEYKICMAIAIATPLLLFYLLPFSSLYILSAIFPLFGLKKSVFFSKMDSNSLGSYLPKTALLLAGYTTFFCFFILID